MPRRRRAWSPGTGPALAVAGVAKRFGSLTVLEAIDFEARAGELVSLVGPNGAGKTTLMRCIADGAERSSGTVVINGYDIGRRPPEGCVALGVGRKFQMANVFDTLTVAECLQIARVRHARPSLWRRASELPLPEAAMHVIATTGLDRQLATPAHLLSHGMKQALELSMVLALEPRVLLLDEPTAGLTKTERMQIGDILIELTKKQGLCMLLVEHDLDFVREISSRVIVLHQGRIVLDGSVEEVVAVRAGEAGLCRLRPCRHRARSRRRKATSQGGAGMSGAFSVDRLSSGYAGARGGARGEPVALAPGEILAVLGKNGMGKSTLLEGHDGLPAEDDRRGHRSAAARRRGLPPHRVARLGVGYVAQEKALFQDLTVEENLRLAVRGPDFDAALAEVEKSFPFLLQRLKQRAGTLSGGEQKMLLMARSLAVGAKFLLVDEITEGLQPSVIDRLGRRHPRCARAAWHHHAAGRAASALRAGGGGPLGGAGPRRDRGERRHQRAGRGRPRAAASERVRTP